MKKYQYKYLTGFQDTNLVGNVYFANFLSWQGRCRELFIKEKAPGLLTEIENNELALITINCSCRFLSELKAFDEVIVMMALDDMQHNRIKMHFEYYKTENGENKKVADGTHEIGCFKRIENELKPVTIPAPLYEALEEYKKS